MTTEKTPRPKLHVLPTDKQLLDLLMLPGEVSQMLRNEVEWLWKEHPIAGQIKLLDSTADCRLVGGKGSWAKSFDIQAASEHGLLKTVQALLDRCVGEIATIDVVAGASMKIFEVQLMSQVMLGYVRVNYGWHIRDACDSFYAGKRGY